MTSRSVNRRAALRSGCMHCLGLTGLFGGLSAQSQTVPNVEAPALQPVVPSGRFARPALDSDEGGLWAMMDREETRLRRSPFAVRDKGLTQYLEDLVCRLAGDHCPDIRIHVVRTPLFNASMAPNGMMQVWTGLLLRVENEAQLAAVLGHEMGHYLERHGVERLRDAKNRAAFAQFLGMFGAVGALGQLGMLAGAFAFSREHEIRADQLGMRLMQRAGYDGQQAARVWDNLLGELEITGGKDAGSRSPMMATHPPVLTRRDDLLRLAGSASGKTGAQEFQQAIARQRFDWLQDEIKRGQFEESLVLLDRLIKLDTTDAQLLYTRGEVYRLRAVGEDSQKSLTDLTQATALQTPPPQTYRSLGLLHKQRQSAAPAIQAFEKYLVALPDAADASLIKNYITEMTP